MSVKIELFHANWCGHCVNFMPTWKEIEHVLSQHAKEIESKYGKVIKFAKYESEADSEKIREQNIQGFPTIKINGVDHNAGRDVVSIVEALIPGIKNDDIKKWFGGNEQSDSKNPNQNGGGRSNQQTSIHYYRYMKYKNKYNKLKQQLRLN